MSLKLPSKRVFFLTAALGVTALSLPLSLAQAQSPPQQKGAMPMTMPADSMDHSKMSGMKNMDGMKSMDGMSMTGDADYDFAVNMKMHHQMALDMAKAEVKDGKNAEMVKMAKSIVSSQTKEIASLAPDTAASPVGRSPPADAAHPHRSLRHGMRASLARSSRCAEVLSRAGSGLHGARAGGCHPPARRTSPSPNRAGSCRSILMT